MNLKQSPDWIVGNLRLCFRRLVDEWNAAEPRERITRWRGELLAFVEAHGAALPENLSDALSPGTTLPTPLEGFENTARDATRAETGAVWAMFAVNLGSDEHNGTSRRLRVTVEDGSPRVPTGWESYETTLDRAAAAVVALLARHPDATAWHDADSGKFYAGFVPGAKCRLQVDDIPGWTQPEQFEFGGESLGFPLAIAAFSAIAGVPAPLEVASTGIVNADGSVAPVNGVDDKIATMRVERPEATRFLIPERCVQTRAFEGVSVERVASLDDLLTKAFGRDWKDVARRSLPSWNKNVCEMVWLNAKAENGDNYARLRHWFGGGDVDPRVLKAIETLKDAIVAGISGDDLPVLLDGVMVAWYGIYWSNALRNRATLVCARVRQDHSAIVGWSRNRGLVGNTIRFTGL